MFAYDSNKTKMKAAPMSINISRQLAPDSGYNPLSFKNVKLGRDCTLSSFIEFKEFKLFAQKIDKSLGEKMNIKINKSNSVYTQDFIKLSLLKKIDYYENSLNEKIYDPRLPF